MPDITQILDITKKRKTIMIKKPIEIFKMMYLVLDKIWQKNKDEQFGLFLSEADPFETGIDSADPAVFFEFTKQFEKYGTYENYGYNFIVQYLSNLDPIYGDIQKQFLSMPMEEFEKDCETYSNMSDKEIIQMKKWEQFYKNIE